MTLTAKKTGRIPTEHEEQRALFDWAISVQIAPDISLRDYMWAIPNGGARSKATAWCLRFEGVTRGVPDLMVAIPAGPFHGLFIEMKRANKRLSRISPEQREWLERLNGQGYCAVVCYGAAEAKRQIINYLKLKETTNNETAAAI